jgi:hypothetical protein
MTSEASREPELILGEKEKSMKQLQVTHGPKAAEQNVTVELPGVPQSEPLRPRMARQAARIACGHERGVTVIDTEAGVGFRIYSEKKTSHRMLKLDDE